MRYFKYTTNMAGIGPCTCYVGPNDPLYRAYANIADGKVYRDIPGITCVEVSKTEYLKGRSI
jgi:hypothetical protein